jgi:hypothetical protein
MKLLGIEIICDFVIERLQGTSGSEKSLDVPMTQSLNAFGWCLSVYGIGARVDNLTYLP